MIGTALAIGSTLASLFGSLNSAAANRAIDRQLRQRQSDLQSWYDNEYNKNYLDTAEARGTVQVLRNNLQDQMKKVDQNNAITGASGERSVATAESGQKNLANAVTRLAGYGTQRKDMIGREFRNKQMYLDNLQGQNLQNKNQQWVNFMGNAMNAGLGAAQASGTGAFDQWDKSLAKWFKGRNGQPITPAATGNLSIPGFGPPLLTEDKFNLR